MAAAAVSAAHPAHSGRDDPMPRWWPGLRAIRGQGGPRCPDPNVLIVREVLDWPDPESQRSLAFDIGANIEDAFGFRHRRFFGSD
jgi:hypothetical protein